MFKILSDYLMIAQIFLSPETKRGVIITNKLIYTSCWRTKTYAIRKYQENLKISYKIIS